MESIVGIGNTHADVLHHLKLGQGSSNWVVLVD
jgi:hypothetical protein